MAEQFHFDPDTYLNMVRAEVPDYNVLQSRDAQDELPAGPFDLVVSALAVHHLDETEKAQLFRNVAERLEPRGRFVLADTRLTRA